MGLHWERRSLDIDIQSAAWCRNRPFQTSTTRFTSTFMFPCVVIYLLLTLNLLTTTIVAPPSNVNKWQMGFNSAFKGLNNQPDALIIQIYSVIKLYMFRTSSLPHHQEFSTIYSALVSFMQGFWWPFPNRVRIPEFQPDSVWKRSSKTCMKITSVECTVENSWWWAKKMPETCRVL